MAKEVKNSLLDTKNSFEDENNVITDTSNDSEPDFDSSDDDTFDLILDADFDPTDNFIDVD